MNRILLESLQVHSLFDPSKFGYDHVIEDSIRYLFVPKGQQVGDYVVDIITVFFKCTRENSEINVNLPFYLVTVNEKEFTVLMETDTDQVVSIENLSFFFNKILTKEAYLCYNRVVNNKPFKLKN